MGPSPASGGNPCFQQLILFYSKISKNFIIIFRHGFGFLKAQMIFGPNPSQWWQPLLSEIYFISFYYYYYLGTWRPKWFSQAYFLNWFKGRKLYYFFLKTLKSFLCIEMNIWKRNSTVKNFPIRPEFRSVLLSFFLCGISFPYSEGKK